MTINKSSRESIVKSLESITENLILNKLIRINNSEYSFIDLEVYYWHKNHPDNYAKGVEHNRPLGEFEHHRYGIDISLGNANNIDFGGILIRGLYDLNSQTVIQKSQVVKTLFNEFVQGNNHFEMVDGKTPWKEIFKSIRIKLGKPDNQNKEEFLNSQYRFLAMDNNIFSKYPDKEFIFRNSNLSDSEIENILGYKLTPKI